MVIAWVAVDDLEANVAMDMFNGTHTAYSDKYEVWNPKQYCSVHRSIQNSVRRHGYDKKHRIMLKPGDAVLFQGLTFHEVTKT